jgi:hypothetical protein
MKFKEYSWFKVVGWGPCPLPGERARLAQALAEADKLMDLLKEIEQRPNGG